MQKLLLELNNSLTRVLNAHHLMMLLMQNKEKLMPSKKNLMTPMLPDLELLLISILNQTLSMILEED